MAIPSYYAAGTATVAANGTTVTGQGTAWLNTIQPGDMFGTHKGSGIRIAAVNSNTSLTLAYPWTGGAQTTATYEIGITPDVARMQESSRQLHEILQNRQFFQFDDSGTLAQRAVQNGRLKGFSYLVTSGTGLGLYFKASDTSGDWAGPYSYAQGDKGDTGPIAPFTFAAPVAAAPDASPAVANLGTPTAPELQFTIPRGQGVRDRGNYAGGTAYDAYDTVLNNGSTWIALVTGPAGVAPPVLPTEANAKWRLFARKGTDGAGDLTGPASAVDGASARFSGTTGKIVTSGQVISTETNLNNYTSEGAFITPASGLTNLPPGWSQGRYVIEVGGGTNYLYHVIHRPASGDFAHRTWTGTAYTGWTVYPNATTDASLLVTGTLPDARVSATLTPDKAFRRGNILGTVSQSSGVPTGGIIERGSNANGEYTKFADGTMECWNNNLAMTFGNSSNLASSWTFPAVFAGSPTVFSQLIGQSFNVVFRNGANAYARAISTTSASVGMVSNAQFVAGNETLDVMQAIAKGRWF